MKSMLVYSLNYKLPRAGIAGMDEIELVSRDERVGRTHPLSGNDMEKWVYEFLLFFSFLFSFF